MVNYSFVWSFLLHSGFFSMESFFTTSLDNSFWICPQNLTSVHVFFDTNLRFIGLAYFTSKFGLCWMIHAGKKYLVSWTIWLCGKNDFWVQTLGCFPHTQDASYAIKWMAWNILIVDGRCLAQTIASRAGGNLHPNIWKLPVFHTRWGPTGCYKWSCKL